MITGISIAQGDRLRLSLDLGLDGMTMQQIVGTFGAVIGGKATLRFAIGDVIVFTGFVDTSLASQGIEVF